MGFHWDWTVPRLHFKVATFLYKPFPWLRSEVGICLFDAPFWPPLSDQNYVVNARVPMRLDTTLTFISSSKR